MSINKTLIAGPRQQLVDLNGETTNFDLTFSALSKDKSDFHVLVVDQETLDANPNIELRKTNEGRMSGNIVSNKDTYQNYFLCIKADKPTEVDITIEKKEIPSALSKQNVPGRQLPPQRPPMATPTSPDGQSG